MKKYKYIVILLLCFAMFKGYGQFVEKMKFMIPQEIVLKSASDNVFFISQDFMMTSLVLKIDSSDYFIDSYIIADNDTLLISSDSHIEDISAYRTSNLIVFKNKISDFYFFPGGIKNEVEFIFINASPSKRLLKKSRPKKNSGLFRTGNDWSE